MDMDTADILDAMLRLREEGEPFALVTVVRTEDATAAKAGAKALIKADGSMLGWVGGGCAQGAVTHTASAALADGQSRLIRVEPEDLMEETEPLPQGVEGHGSRCPSRGTMELFIEPVLPRPALVVVGAAPVAKALARLANNFDYAVTVACAASDRPRSGESAFGTTEHFIEVSEIATVCNIAGAFVIVATQGKRDRDALLTALESPAPFVGFVGSPRKVAALKKAMAEAGVPDARLRALRGPVGLDLGAVTPEEIALTILAEILQVRHSEALASEETEGATLFSLDGARRAD